jgi:hypothetical protein
MTKTAVVFILLACSITAAMFSLLIFETSHDRFYLNFVISGPESVEEVGWNSKYNETIQEGAGDVVHSTLAAGSEKQPFYFCNFSSLEEVRVRPPCTFRVCTESGHEVLLNQLFTDSDAVKERCVYGKHILRNPNIFSSVEQASSHLKIGETIMFPGSNFTETARCEEWFFTHSQASRGMEFIRQYLSQRIPTSGISYSVMYAHSMRMTSLNNSKTELRYLVIYAAATVDEYRVQVSNYTLRRLRAVLGPKTFIILVEASKFKIKLFETLADVILHADFVSPDSFYDSVAMQEGMLEAFRLFGINLFGFDGLLIMNDSIIGPISGGIINILPMFPSTQPLLVAAAVWSKVIISGSGLLLNRAAFTTAAFSDFWQYVRIPCGKWGSMLLWEGQLHISLLAGTESKCYTFTNDIKALSSSPSVWDERGLPFYKHKNGNDRAEVVRFIKSRFPDSIGSVQSLEVCDL